MTLRHFDFGSGAFEAYIANPVLPNHAAILLLPEIYNISGWIRSAAERYAGQGFHVLAPDLYWRREPGQHLEYNPADQQTGRILAAELDRPQSVADLRDVVAHWRKELPGGTPIIAVGYCLGGELALLAAAAGYIDGVSAYYPTRLGEHLDQGRHIAVPTQIHFGELDYRTPAALIQATREATPPEQVDIHVHLGADHGFGRFGHPPYHADAAAEAHRLTTRLAERLVAETTTEFHHHQRP